MEPETSLIIPMYNEEDNLVMLYDQIRSTKLPKAYHPIEIIFVDDGSTDHSAKIAGWIAANDPHVRLIQLQGNRGKTAALDAGFRAAKGQIIVTLDADLQDDPAELPWLVKGLLKHDLVCAWRVNRAENDPLDKTLPSAIYNLVVRKMTGVQLHDFNCGYKAYRREVVDSLKLYGELHRFIPVLAVWQGFRVTEQEVQHRPRYAGQSKFGASRLLKGLLDFVTVLFLTKYLKQPLHLFGLAGMLSILLGVMANVYLAVLWLIRSVGLADIPPIGTRPLFLVAILAIIFGVQLVSIGLVGEMIRFFSFNRSLEYTAKEVTTNAEKRQLTETHEPQQLAPRPARTVSH